jgi:hypothetical protein
MISREGRQRTFGESIGRIAALAALVSACAADRPLPTAAAAAVSKAPPVRASYIVASDSVLPAGGDLVVTGNVDAATGSERVASFLARLEFDTRQLEFVSDDALPGVMRAVNPGDGVVVIAGATATGMPDARLFVMHFRTKVAVSQPAFSLSIVELNTVQFANRISSLHTFGLVRFDHTLK